MAEIVTGVGRVGCPKGAKRVFLLLTVTGPVEKCACLTQGMVGWWGKVRKKADGEETSVLFKPNKWNRLHKNEQTATWENEMKEPEKWGDEKKIKKLEILAGEIVRNIYPSRDFNAYAVPPATPWPKNIKMQIWMSGLNWGVHCTRVFAKFHLQPKIEIRKEGVCQTRVSIIISQKGVSARDGCSLTGFFQKRNLPLH